MKSIELKSERKKSKPLWLEYAQALLVALVLAFIIRAFIFQPYKIPSGSMLDTLLIGDRLLGTKYDYGIKIPFTHVRLFEGTAPQRGDIVIFEYPKNPSTDFIKRIIGIPGDIIEVRNKQLYRNGEALKESYIRIDNPNEITPIRDNFGPVTVPEGKYFCMGDNRDNSYDSRFWGFVDRDAIEAKARFILWSWGSLTDIRWDRIGMTIK